MRLGSDHGAIGVPGIVKLAVAFAVLGVLGYDTFVTIATHLKAENDAQNAAFAASTAWENAREARDNPGATTAYEAAIQYLAGQQGAGCAKSYQGQAAPNSVPLGCDYLCTGASDQAALCGTHGAFSVDPDSTVHLVVRREAKTLVFGHLGFMHSLLVAYEHGDANQSNG